MEAGSDEAANLGHLGFELLHVVLAKIPDAGLVRFTNSTRRKNLGDGDERDGARIAAGSRGGAVNPVADLRYSLAHAHGVLLNRCCFPIPVVYGSPVLQHDGVVFALHGVPFSLPTNRGLQPVAANIVVVLRLDLGTVDLAKRDIGFHFFAGVVEAHGALGLAAFIRNREPELAARAGRAAPVADKVASNGILGECRESQGQHEKESESKASHADKNSSRQCRSQVTIRTVSKTATRRAPGRSAEELQAAVERFLKASRQPALLEPGEPIIPLTGANLSLEVRSSRLTVQAWDEQRNVVRRIIDIQEEARGRLELVAERFAGRRGSLYLVDLARPAGPDWERRGTRLVFRERFRQFLSREFPAWRITEVSTEQDLEHSLSPAFPRAFLKHGSSGLAAIGSPPDGLNASGVLSFGLIWLEYLRRRERRATVEGLVLFAPAGQERTTALRLRCLNHERARFELFAYSDSGRTARLDLRDAGNLETKLDVCRLRSNAHSETTARLVSVPGVEQVTTSDGEASLRVRGLEFARTAGAEMAFGLGERVPLSAANMAECEKLARDLVRLRGQDAGGGDLYLRNPEAWLESQVRRNLDAIDPSLAPNPVYGQVPAFAGGDRGIIDLLAADRAGRLAVIELKASADLHLPLQALDYWMRVNWHLERDEFGPHGYFPGTPLKKDPPRLLLVAPALEFHPTTEGILSYFAPNIEVERTGLGSGWRHRVNVMFRLRGAEQPA